MTRVSDLAGDHLPVWVARAIGMDVRGNDCGYWVVRASSTQFFEGYIGKESGGLSPQFAPHEDWAQGGPLLEEYAIGFEPISDAEWMAEEHITCCTGRGPTPLIAAMRALVASVYGDTVE